MAYRSELEARLAKKTTKAIVDFDMLEDGDRVMVGLSGGKDSWALLQILDVLRQRAPIRFSVVAVNVDSGYKEYKHDVIAQTCEARGWEYRIEHTGIGELIEDILDADQTPCSLCARKDARWNDVITRAFRCRLDQDRCFDLGVPLRGHVATDLVDDAMAQKQVSLKLRAAQIEITILQTQIFARECVRSGIELKRWRARIVEREQLPRVYFNVAGS